jgi:hypothetical protein
MEVIADISLPIGIVLRPPITRIHYTLGVSKDKHDDHSQGIMFCYFTLISLNLHLSDFDIDRTKKETNNTGKRGKNQS